jgi:cobyrinic acid a,c-diamide synthase
MTARGLIIAAPRSGAGKTTITLALLCGLARRGISVRAAKVGPDYIDPAFHAAASGTSGVNLDSWAMSSSLLNTLVADAAANCELLLIEGVMGLFDGASGTPGQTGATADIAARLHLPVLLALDISGQSQSAAAVVRGFATHDPAVRLAGVVLNRAASDRHRTLVGEAIASLNIPILGTLRRDEQLTMPERHLGLVQAAEHSDLAGYFQRLADIAERSFDLDAIIATAAPLPSVAAVNRPALKPPGQIIALASDAAFSFIYPHLLQGWRNAGAEIVTFSPLDDQPPPERCDTCWLPGGYPELHPATLSNAQRFREGLVRFAQTRSVHGECGGYMVLGAGLEGPDGQLYPMAGLLGHVTSFAKRKLHLGYREARLLADCSLGAAETVVRGHEFHYATLVAAGDDPPLVECRDAQKQPLGLVGGRRGRVTGSFFHVIAEVQDEQA